VQLLVEAPGDALASENVGSLFDYVAAVQDVPGVQRVDSIVTIEPSLGREEYQKLYSRPPGQLDPTLASFVDRFTEGGVTLVSAVLSSHAMSDEALDATATIRAIEPADELTILAGGQSASFVDVEDAVFARLPFALAFISMDYEVFLLSRIKEEYDATGDNQASVARGLERTGRIITSAALLLVVVTGAFATSEIIFIKQVGVGTALAVALDATIIRALLVPATMRLMGSLNRWAPGPLQRIWLRLGIGNLEGGSPRAEPEKHGLPPEPAPMDDGRSRT